MLTISVPSDIRRTLLTALRRSGTIECGGVLMGEHVGLNSFIVRNLTIQGGGSFASFIRGTRSALRALTEYFRRSNHDYTRFNYLGEWHSHPSFSVQPSSTDHQSMKAIATAPDVGANFVVLLIFRLTRQGQIEGSAHTYLPNGSVFESHLVFEEQHDIATL